MRNLAIWAAAHPVDARFLIAMGHIFLVFNALWLGFLLYAANIRIPQQLTLLLLLLFAAVYLLYPAKQAKYYTFGRRKAADFILIAAYTFAIAGYYNADWLAEEKARYLAERQSVTFMQTATRAREQPRENLSAFGQVKQLRKELRAALRQLKEDKPLSGGMKALLIALSILGLLGVALLVAGIACNIACSGSEGLAWVVLILGWSGIIFLAVLLIRGIIRRPTKRKVPQTVEQTQ
ncbi:hypothetical protein [Rhodoflexus caldus]|uniref:hypothetical protein n=1 Tax=Rhodoflexus caldus TaxID=2891236 RepID=UPI00202A2C85|nr:hypothetical protein [Rhodoflexus caldus]